MIRTVLVVVAVIVPGLAAVEAQQSQPRPYRGLFGPADRDERRPPQLTLTLSVYAGLDDNSRFESAGALDEPLQSGQTFQGLQASLGFMRRRSRSTIRIDAASTLRYYSDLNRVTTQKHGTTISGSLRASPRVMISLAQSVSYSPSYQLALGMSRETAGAGSGLTGENPEESRPDLATAGVDYAVSREKQMAYGSVAAITYVPNRSGQLSVDYTARYEDFFTRSDFATQRAFAAYTHRLTPAIDLRLGYGVGSLSLAGAPHVSHHNVDIGVNYRRSFALSRRTSIGFTTGSAIVSASDRRHFEVLGSARLRRMMSSRWAADLAYQRALQMLDQLPRPFVADTVTATVSGYFNRRVSVRVMPGYARGADVSDPGRTYESWVGQGRVDVAVSSHWAIYAEHFYYNYRFAMAADLPAVLAAGLNRHGLRWGLALWAPLSR